jgi:uncharacterized protein
MLENPAGLSSGTTRRLALLCGVGFMCLASCAHSPATKPPAAAGEPSPPAGPPLAAAETSQAAVSPSAGAVTRIVGKIKAPGGIDLDFVAVLDGKGGGTLDIPAQGLEGGALDDVVLSKETIAFALTSVDAHWKGAIKPDGHIECAFVQQGMSLPCDMERRPAGDLAGPAKPSRPQTPKPPFPYDSQDVAYESGAAGIRLGGTLTVPAGPGPHPAALLVSGSGAQDRDESVFGHRPFWVLADHLSRKGIAVLRVDDRGVGQSSKGSARDTSLDFAGDVRAGLRFLKNDARIDARRIGLIGHSEGATIAPLVAATERSVAFVVMLAGPGIKGGDLLVEQAVAVKAASGASPAAIDEARRKQRQVVDIVLSTPDDSRARERIQTALDPTGANSQQLKGQIDALLSPWFRHFLAFDPAPTLSKVRCPILALIGDKDVQVPADQNIPALKKALRHNRRARVEKLEGLNHLFQHAKTGAPQEYTAIAETMAPAVLQLIDGWIAAVTRKRES